MKAITKLTGILIISLLAMSCATTSLKVPEKYNFDNELTAATEITSYRIDSWESIDYQSLIIRTNVNDYYLIILDYPAFELPSKETIGITVTIDRVKTGFERIIVSDPAGTQSYVIHKMYKLNGREQATEIKKRLKKS